MYVRAHYDVCMYISACVSECAHMGMIVCMPICVYVDIYIYARRWTGPD